MNVKRIVILSIIAVLIAAFILQRFVDFSGSPEVDTWEGSPDRITITPPDGAGDAAGIVLDRAGSQWTVTGNEYPADKDTVETLADALRDLTLLDVVSRHREYARYELDEGNAVRVAVEKDGSTVLDLLIGKAGSTSRQCYVKLAGRDEVYLAAGNLRSETDKDVLAFRDKHIFDLETGDIDRISVEYGDGEAFIMVKEDAEAVFRVAGRDDIELDPDKVSTFLRAFANVNARSFPDEPGDLPEPACIVQAFQGNRRASLTIFPKAEEADEYIARSSETPYVFTLSTYQAERFMKKVEDLAK